MKYPSLTIMAVAAALALGGCVTEVHLTPTGGSRADGTVDMSYEYGFLEKPQLHLEEALESARQRCAAWGYPDAQAFGGQKTQCQERDIYGNCLKFFATVTYQCLGAPSASPQANQ